MPPRLALSPPLLNSSSPWATTVEDLRALYDSPHTGAVTTRTALRDGMTQSTGLAQHAFFSTSSLNTYGYSPYPLTFYLCSILDLVVLPQKKPFIVSIAGTPSDVATCVSEITAFAREYHLTLAVEINLSCPNIPQAPPPGYAVDGLTSYLSLLPANPEIPVGIKLPPYTYQTQYGMLLSVLATFPSTLSFITAINTLGSCLHLTLRPCSDGGRKEFEPTLARGAETGVGGLGGEAVHWLALGNVDTLRRGLDGMGLGDVAVVGVGGVGDRVSWLRMLSVGAGAVGVGTALGREGVKVFKKILAEEEVVGERK